MKNLLYIFILLSLLSCNSLLYKDPGSFKNEALFGMIYDFDNKAVSGAEITINGKIKVSSDIDGRFIIPSLDRGNHKLLASKNNFEILNMDFEFLNKTQVLYLKMISFEQILKASDKLINTRNWLELENTISRAEKINEKAPNLIFLKAVYNYRINNNEEAVNYLNQLLENGYKEAYVYLFLADIYEYKLNEKEKSLENLTEYIKLRVDPEAEERLTKLKSE